MSIGITILTGSNAPVMTEQVKIYLCVGYTEKEDSCLLSCVLQKLIGNSKMNHTVKVVLILLKHLKCFERRSIILCVDIIITETGRQGGTYQAATPLLKIANSIIL